MQYVWLGVAIIAVLSLGRLATEVGRIADAWSVWIAHSLEEGQGDEARNASGETQPGE